MSTDKFVWTDELVERAIVWCLQYKEFLNMEMMKDEFRKSFDVASKEVKKPILTTEDGKDIFENERCWFVNNADFTIDFYDFQRYSGNDDADLAVYHDLHKYFSTEEAAKEYIIENKPCLSVNEILSANIIYPHMKLSYSRLIELAKTKIDGIQ